MEGVLPLLIIYYSVFNSLYNPISYYNIIPSSFNVTANPCHSTIIEAISRSIVDDINILANIVSAYQEIVTEHLSQIVTADSNNTIISEEVDEMMALQQEASDLYYKTARRIMFDNLMDLSMLEILHRTASVFSDPYSLSETQYQMDETADYANITIDNSDERENYIAFRNLKAECAAQTTERGVNWYALSDRQIEELMRIAERNTGRSSVMAKGILCFFYKICYEDEEENIDTRSIMNQNVENLPIDEFRGGDMDTKENKVQEEQNIVTISLYPNPAKQTVTILFSENQEIVNKVMFVNMQGVTVLSEEKPNRNTIDISVLPVGIYVVRVLSQSGKTYSAKLVKE